MANSITKYLSGIGAKRLSEVEIKPDTSNQHEFNGISEFKEILGAEKIKFDTKFILLNDDVEKIVEAEGSMTWYDARENHATRTEFRLYYTSNSVIDNAVPGDLVVIGRTGKSNLAVIVAPSDSTSEKQLMWLFRLAEVGNRFTVKDFSEVKEDLGFAGKYILSSLGFETDETDEGFLPLLQRMFGNRMPPTAIFSEFARSTLKDVSALDDPDSAVVKWMEREEMLFKVLEKNSVEEKLIQGFGKNGIDVDDFIHFSLSVHNTRKSRAGFAFEHHLAKIFDVHSISYSKGKKTEMNRKPDFIFPGIDQYRNTSFDTSLLTMLGLKTTAKDRWRQVLSEAARIELKHLITLEPSISKNQTDEMKSENLKLVVPIGIIETYSVEQRSEMLTLKDFIGTVREKQKKINT